MPAPHAPARESERASRSPLRSSRPTRLTVMSSVRATARRECARLGAEAGAEHEHAALAGGQLVEAGAEPDDGAAQPARVAAALGGSLRSPAARARARARGEAPAAPPDPADPLDPPLPPDDPAVEPPPPPVPPAAAAATATAAAYRTDRRNAGHRRKRGSRSGRGHRHLRQVRDGNGRRGQRRRSRHRRRRDGDLRDAAGPAAAAASGTDGSCPGAAAGTANAIAPATRSTTLIRIYTPDTGIVAGSKPTGAPVSALFDQ